MKTVFTSHEIAHVWAHKSAPHGRCPANMHFDSAGAFYSYNTVVARHIEHKGKPAILLNETHYSPSTSNHQSGVRSAIRGLDIPVFRVDGQSFGEPLRYSGAQLFTHYVERAAMSEAQALKPRIRQTTKDSHHAQAASYLEQAKAVSDFFGLRRKVDAKAVARLADAKAREEKRLAAERAQREAAYRIREAEEIEKTRIAYEAWKQGEGADRIFGFRDLPVAFRVEGEELVSTLGARVPLRAAQIAYRFALAKRAKGEWRENGNVASAGEQCPVGMYRLNVINEQGIVAGCHVIKWAEIERLAPVLSGETVNA